MNLDKFRLEDKNGETVFKVDPILMGEQSWIERRIISEMGRDVVDISVPGETLIQFSSFGLSSINPTGEMINKGRKLKLFNDKTGGVEAVVSMSFFNDILKMANLSNATQKEKYDYLIKNKIIR